MGLSILSTIMAALDFTAISGTTARENTGRLNPFRINNHLAAPGCMMPMKIQQIVVILCRSTTRCRMAIALEFMMMRVGLAQVSIHVMGKVIVILQNQNPNPNENQSLQVRIKE